MHPKEKYDFFYDMNISALKDTKLQEIFELNFGSKRTSIHAITTSHSSYYKQATQRQANQQLIPIWHIKTLFCPVKGKAYFGATFKNHNPQHKHKILNSNLQRVFKVAYCFRASKIGSIWCQLCSQSRKHSLQKLIKLIIIVIIGFAISSRS